MTVIEANETCSDECGHAFGHADSSQPVPYHKYQIIDRLFEGCCGLKSFATFPHQRVIGSTRLQISAASSINCSSTCNTLIRVL